MSSNPSAFPIPDLYTNDGIGISEGWPGMTLRDYFAARAMQAALEAMPPRSFETAAEMGALVAEAAYLIADAMLSARTQESTPC